MNKAKLHRAKLHRAKLYNAIVASVMNNGEMDNMIGETISVTLITRDKNASIRGKLTIEDVTRLKPAGKES